MNTFITINIGVPVVQYVKRWPADLEVPRSIHRGGNYVSRKRDPLSFLSGYMINRTLHSWSIQMKCMKLAKGLCHKFYMKWPLL